MDRKDAVKLWMDGAKRAKVMAVDTFKMKHYDWSLFFWQLALEKLLKAILISKNLEIVLTHNLVYLLNKSGIVMTENEKEMLNEITTFNIEARYQNIKDELYRKANKRYAEKWVLISESYYKKFVGELKNE